MVRVYPCGVFGPAYVRALRAPMPEIKLVAAGGVNLQTAAHFLNAGAVALEIDADLVDLDALRGGRVQEIATSARLYIDVVVEALSLLRAPPQET
jgi:2-dehydro-3-deoxyphosphogluconate aldolase/(4S)-4-hydroxy-2-oxoglutarate aldolase